MLWVAACEPPLGGIINNGEILIESDSYEVGAELMYICAPGFASRDPLITECQGVTFAWTLDNSLPNCRKSKNYYNITEAIIL